MNYAKLHDIWVKLRPVSYIHLLAACAVMTVISVVALRQNNLQALKLRDHVLKVDQQNGNIETALRELRSYVYGHMNTNLAANNGVYPPLQLKSHYERLVAAEKARVDAANAQAYKDGQAVCAGVDPGPAGQARLQCVQAHVAAHTTKAQPVPDDLYKFDFQSPTWSPDLAGFSLIITAFLGLGATLQFAAQHWLRRRRE